MRVLSKRGIRCYVVDDTTNIIARSRWHRPTQPTLEETSDPEVLATSCVRSTFRAAVLVPCSDNWSLAASGLPDELRERFPRSLSPRDVVEQFVDKERSASSSTGWGSRARDRSPGGSRRPRPTVRRGVSNAFFKPTDPSSTAPFGTKGTFVHSRAEADRACARARRWA